MVNYQVDPSILTDLVPSGTELDSWDDRCLVSMVGFEFLDTRVLGIPIPMHRDFEEVNLRFYVKRPIDGDVRRGVVFVKEIVPRRAIAWLANALYNERYVALPMSHGGSMGAVEYGWRHDGRACRLAAERTGEPYVPDDDSEETFITEHYWGYTRQRDGSTLEYEVRHPRWSVQKGIDPVFDCDVARLYGSRFAPYLEGRPSSCFVAGGSGISVYQGVRID